MHKRIFLIFFTLFLISSLSSAAVFTISLPKQVKTYKDFLSFRIKGTKLNLLKINKRVFEVKYGQFEAGTVLSPGKNLIVITGSDTAGKTLTRYIKILRLVSYDDLANHWAVNEIVALATLGIIEGYPDNNFYPQIAITRGEFATWLARTKGIKKIYSKEDPFSDVPKEYWRAPYIAAVVQKGYMKETSKNNFGIDDPVSRAQAFAIAIKAEDVKVEKELEKTFGDVKFEHPFYYDIKEAKEKALTKGISKKWAIFDPDRNITRAETAVLFSRFKRTRWLRKWLYDFEEGYKKRLCKINTAPIIKSMKLTPNKLYTFAESTIVITAKVFDLEGLDNISNVVADLLDVGGPPDAAMYDTGKDGDREKGDGEYTLSIKLTPEKSGVFNIKVIATDQYGWRGIKEEELQIIGTKTE